MVNLNVAAKYLLTNPVLRSSRVIASTLSNNLIVVENLSYTDNQLWYLSTTNNSAYFRLHTVQKGNDWALDVLNYNGYNSIDVQFQAVGDKSGQYWRFDDWSDGTVKISNNYTGPDIYLQYTDGASAPSLVGSDSNGAHWSLNVNGSTPTSTPSATATTLTTVKSTGTASATGTQASGSSTATPSESASPHHTSKGAIAGGVVGGLIGLAVLVGLGIWIYRRRSTSPEPQYAQGRLETTTYHI